MVKELDNGENYVGRISGGQKPVDRERSIALLDPRITPNDKPVIIIGNPMSGGMGLNLAASHTVYYSSNDYNLKTRLQSEDRVHRPGQEHPVSYYDAMAVGPNGEKTIDHSILKVIREKEEVATWTTQAWIRELQDE
jgi:SNF2 family DNA or RNA helicase